MLLAAPWYKYCQDDEICHCFAWFELPMWLQRQFVGMDIAKEVAISYYRSVDPVRYSVYASDLDMLLLNDHFHIGILPYELLRQTEDSDAASDSNQVEVPPDHKDYMDARAF